jgi:aminoglycoside phosphotransferase (APT) family kinase protein
MDRLEKAGLPSLKIVALDESDEALGCPFLVMQQAPGRPLRDFENPETQALPEPALFELGRLLAQIHTIPGRAAGLLLYCSDEHGPIGAHTHWINYVRLRLRAHAEVCQEIGAINSKEVEEIRHIFTVAEPLLTSAPKRFLHGDPGHHNVFFDGQRITAIIDWEDALVGDPVFDIAYWGTFVRDEMRERFLEGYRSVAALPQDFEHRYWLYYLRVALSKTVHRHHFGAKDRPGRPPASQRIQKALSKLRDL